jgi:uncharacterized protein with GYD domain
VGRNYTPSVYNRGYAPDDETVAAVLLAADMLGNIRTQTLRAFTVPEMEKILLANIR